MAAPLIIDFETASTVDLKRTGSNVYARDPNTKVLCAAYCFGDGPIEVWRIGDPPPLCWFEHNGLIVAHNTAFELDIWRHNLSSPSHLTRWWHPPPEVSRFRDTMLASAYHGGPMNLDDCSTAWNLKHRKDHDGHRLMMRMCRPRKIHDDGELSWWHEDDPERFEALIEYCRKDVAAERELWEILPPCPDSFWAEWHRDLEINRQGLPVDHDLVNKLDEIVRKELKRLNALLKTVTGETWSVTNAGALTEWLRDRGVPTESLAKDQLDELIEVAQRQGDVEATIALEIRQEAAKSSAAKLAPMVRASGPDKRVRNAFQFYGAARTGRVAGRLVQPQNYPRPLKNLDHEAVTKQILRGASPEEITNATGFPAMSVVSSCLRSCFKPNPGYVFHVVDYAQIEARVIAWLAGQEDILDVFRRGEDVYVYTAAQIGSKDRQLGKQCALGLGFGMGHRKFADTLRKAGMVDAPYDRLPGIVSTWRERNSSIKELWWDLDDAFKQAASARPGTTYRVGSHLKIVAGEHRRVRTVSLVLPSGRPLVYRNPRIKQGKWEDGSPKDIVVFDGVDQITKQWGPVVTYGGKLAENATQAAARDVMYHGLAELVSKGFTPIGTVHDEVLVEHRDLGLENEKVLEKVCGLMRKIPAWACNLPIEVEGKVMWRYGK